MADQVDHLIAAPFKAAYRRYRALSDRARRILTVSVIAPLFIAITTGPSIADDGSGTGALGWVDIKDSHGISITRFGTLSLDRGGVTHAGRLAWSVLTEMVWTVYEIYIIICCWLIDWTLSMDWVGWLATPVMSMGDNLQHIVDSFGLTPTLLTVTACVACVWMMKGRWVLGIFELFMSMIIASLAIGILANPVRLVAGSDGMLSKSRDVGLQVAVGLKNDGNVTGDSEQLRKELVSGVADTFLRQPNQIVNYGEVLDTKGGDCVETYDEKVGDSDKDAAGDVKDACDIDTDKTGVDPGDPSSGMFMNALALAPAGFIALLFSAILCGAVLVAGGYALYQSLKLVVALIAGLLPGGARGSLWMTFAELAISLVTIVFAIVFLSAYLLLLQGIFASTADGGGGGMKAFFVMDLMLMVGLVVFWKGRARLKAATERLAAAMAKRPGGGGATALPQKTRFNAADAYYKGRLAMQGARMAGGAAGALGGGAATAGALAGKGAAKVGKAAYGEVDQSFARIKFASQFAQQQNRGAGDRLQERLALGQPSRKGQLVRLGAAAAAAAATGGTSAVVGTVVRHGTSQAAAQMTRRAALSGRLRPALEAGPGGRDRGLPPGSGNGPALNGGPGTPPALGGGPQRTAPRLPTGTGTIPSSNTPAVVTGSVVATAPKPPRPAETKPDPESVARLRARLAERRAIPLPGPNRD